MTRLVLLRAAVLLLVAMPMAVSLPRKMVLLRAAAQPLRPLLSTPLLERERAISAHCPERPLRPRPLGKTMALAPFQAAMRPPPLDKTMALAPFQAAMRPQPLDKMMALAPFQAAMRPQPVDKTMALAPFQAAALPQWQRPRPTVSFRRLHLAMMPVSRMRLVQTIFKRLPPAARKRTRRQRATSQYWEPRIGQTLLAFLFSSLSFLALFPHPSLSTLCFCTHSKKTKIILSKLTPVSFSSLRYSAFFEANEDSNQVNATWSQLMERCGCPGRLPSPPPSPPLSPLLRPFSSNTLPTRPLPLC